MRGIAPRHPVDILISWCSILIDFSSRSLFEYLLYLGVMNFPSTACTSKLFSRLLFLIPSLIRCMTVCWYVMLCYAYLLLESIILYPQYHNKQILPKRIIFYFSSLSLLSSRITLSNSHSAQIFDPSDLSWVQITAERGKIFLKSRNRGSYFNPIFPRWFIV